MLVYQESFVRMYFYKETGIFEVEWLDFVGSDKYKNALTTALRLAKQHGATYWLANNRQMRTLRASDQKWTSEVWFRDFTETGPAKLAIVESDDAMNRMSISNIMAKARQYLTMNTQYFQSRAQAWKWLNEPVPVTQHNQG